MNNNVEARYGYTMDDLDKITRHILVLNSERVRSIDRKGQYEIAWHGVAEFLSQSEEKPTFLELKEAGWLALNREHHKEKSAHGKSGKGIKFDTFWYDRERNLRFQSTSVPEDSTVEVIAATQIINALIPSHRNAIYSLAAADGDMRKAAELMGLTYNGFKSTLNYARRAFLELWHEGESSSRFWKTSKRYSPESQNRPRVKGRFIKKGAEE